MVHDSSPACNRLTEEPVIVACCIDRFRSESCCARSADTAPVPGWYDSSAMMEPLGSVPRRGQRQRRPSAAIQPPFSVPATIAQNQISC